MYYCAQKFKIIKKQITMSINAVTLIGSKESKHYSVARLLN